MEYDHHHHLILMSETKDAGLRCLVGLIFGLELGTEKEDPLSPVMRSLVLFRSPEWPIELRTKTARLKFLFGIDGAAAPAPARLPPPAMALSGLASTAAATLANPMSPMDDAGRMDEIDFIISMPKDMARILASGRNGLRGRLSDWWRWIFSSETSAGPPKFPPLSEATDLTNVRITAYYGAALGSENATERLNSQVTAHWQESQSGNETKTAEPDSRPGKPPKPQSISFLIAHRLSPETPQKTVGLARKIDRIQRISSNLDRRIVGTGVVSLCLSDTLIPASRLPVANSIDDGVQLLLQERDLGPIWMENAWVDIFGTVYSEDYRAIVARHWSEQNPADARAADKLTAAGQALLLMDCDFGGIDAAAREIAYLQAPAPRFRDDDTEPDMIAAQRYEHTLFGGTAIALAKHQLNGATDEAVLDRLESRWRPYRAAAVLIACLVSNNEAGQAFCRHYRIACAAFGRGSFTPDRTAPSV